MDLKSVKKRKVIHWISNRSLFRHNICFSLKMLELFRINDGSRLTVQDPGSVLVHWPVSQYISEITLCCSICALLRFSTLVPCRHHCSLPKEYRASSWTYTTFTRCTVLHFFFSLNFAASNIFPSLKISWPHSLISCRIATCQEDLADHLRLLEYRKHIYSDKLRGIGLIHKPMLRPHYNSESELQR